MNLMDQCVEMVNNWKPAVTFAEIHHAIENVYKGRYPLLSKETLKKKIIEICKKTNLDAPEILVDIMYSEKIIKEWWRENSVFIKTNNIGIMEPELEIFYYNNKFYVVEDFADNLISVYEFDNFDKALEIKEEIKIRKFHPEFRLGKEKMNISQPELYEYNKKFPGEIFVFNEYGYYISYCEKCGDLIRVQRYFGNDGCCISCDIEMCDKCGEFDEEGNCKSCQTK